MQFRSLASLTILALGLGVAPSLSAQTPAPTQAPSRGPGTMQARALQGITLTPAQQAKIDSIGASTRAKMPKMTPGTPLSDADRQQAMGLMASSRKEVRAVLTPDQQVVYDKNVAAMQQLMQERMQGGGMPPQAAPPQGAPAKP